MIELENNIGEVLRELGYRKRGKTYFKLVSKFRLLINLQRSQWEPKLYLNTGITHVALDTELKTASLRPRFDTRIEELLFPWPNQLLILQSTKFCDFFDCARPPYPKESLAKALSNSETMDEPLRQLVLSDALNRVCILMESLVQDELKFFEFVITPGLHFADRIMRILAYESLGLEVPQIYLNPPT